MAPYIWLFLKMFFGLLALGLIGFLIGWAMRGKSILSKIDRLENDAKSANDASAKAKLDAEKFQKTNTKLENQIKGLRKSSAPREEFDAMRTKLTSAEGDVSRLRNERDSAQHQLDGFRETSVSGAEVSELKRELERNQSQVRKLKAKSEKKEEELKAVQSKEVHDLVGFKDGRDDEVKELTLENVRLREILNKVQTGDKKSLLQLADEARTGSAQGEEAEAGGSAAGSAEVATLRTDNERLQGELEIAKKKLLTAKGVGAAGAVVAGGAAIAVERERDQLKVELAKARATGGGSSDADSTALKAEVASLKKDRDQLTIQLAEAKRESSPGKSEQGSTIASSAAPSEAGTSSSSSSTTSAKAIAATAAGAAAVAGATAVAAAATSTGDKSVASASAAGAAATAGAVASATAAKAGSSNVSTAPKLVACQPKKCAGFQRPWPNNIPHATRIRQRLWKIEAADAEDEIIEEKSYPLGELALDRQQLTTRF